MLVRIHLVLNVCQVLLICIFEKVDFFLHRADLVLKLFELLFVLNILAFLSAGGSCLTRLDEFDQLLCFLNIYRLIVLLIHGLFEDRKNLIEDSHDAF